LKANEEEEIRKGKQGARTVIRERCGVGVVGVGKPKDEAEKKGGGGGKNAQRVKKKPQA